MNDSRADLDAYFGPVSDVIMQFAVDHHLTLEKYYHDFPIWSLCFGHPSGGQAKIEIKRMSEEFVEVGNFWWIDNFSLFTRSMKNGEKVTVSRQPDPLKKNLKRSLEEVLSWKIGDWTQIASDYQKSWSTFSEVEFSKFALKWPVARP